MPGKFRLFIQLSQPLYLLGGGLVYTLGVGIARYLGIQVDWGLFFLGQAIVTTLQLSAHYLDGYFGAPTEANQSWRGKLAKSRGVIGEGKLPRNIVLLAAYTTLTILSALVVLLIRFESISPILFMILLVSSFGAIFYSTPPIKLANSGYGELTASILLTNVVPAFACVLQFGEFHRLLAMSTFPLTALHMAMLVALELPEYANDIKQEKMNLLVRIGWQRGMALHNILILVAYALLVLAAIFGLPLAITLPALLTFPLGLLQIWQMRRIAAGIKPNWIALRLTAVVLFGIFTYLLTFSFWTR